jgi:hypothetical protein
MPLGGHQAWGRLKPASVDVLEQYGLLSKGDDK